VIADAVPDGSAISPAMLLSIQRFSLLLEEIKFYMVTIADTGGVSRVLHLNRNERTLQRIKTQLDEAYCDFLAASVLRLEIQQTALSEQQTRVHLGIQDISATTSNLALDLRRLQWTILFGRPLQLPYKLHSYPLLRSTQPIRARGAASQGTHPAYLHSLVWGKEKLQKPTFYKSMIIVHYGKGSCM